MDEDLKIVLTSELEADEEASAQRISAQLPNIAKLINSKSSIKVGVTLDEAGIQSQTQRITQQIARATKSQSVGVSLSLDQSSVNKIKTELNNLKVSPDISRAMTDQLDQMGIQIDRITPGSYGMELGIDTVGTTLERLYLQSPAFQGT